LIGAAGTGTTWRLGFLFFFLSWLSLAGTAAAAQHPRAFWREIVRTGYKVPAGESPAALLRELSGYLGSPDPEMRDELSAAITEEWIYQQKLLTPSELRELLARWSANLKVGLGESGTDSVLLRSFSALDLSFVAARDNERPFLTAAESAALLTAALDYLDGERDVRGYDPQKSWMHSAAHTGDLLKFLGRGRHLKPADPERIVAAIGRKMESPGAVFTYDEDERLAAAVASLVRREDFDTAPLFARLDRVVKDAKTLFSGRLDPRRFAAIENWKHLLRSLHVQLALVEEKRKEPGKPAKPAPGVAPTRHKILACLDEM
jgi:hypothetical protein